MNAPQLLKDCRSDREIIDFCDQQIAELRAEGDELLDVATQLDRDLNDKECSRLNSLNAKLDSFIAAKHSAESRGQAKKLQGRIDRGEIHFDSHSQKEMLFDNRGNRFAILNRNQKLADFFEPQCENAFGHYVLAKTFGPSRATPEPIRNALGEGVNTAGGYLVPEQLASEVIDLARARSVLMRAGTRTIAMTSDAMLVPKLETDATVSIKAENEAITASDMTFSARNLRTYTAAAMTKISRELWEDSPQLLAQQIESWLVAKMAQQVDQWGLQGTGVGQPLGLVNRTEIDETGSVGAIDWADVSAAATAVRVANHEPDAIVLHPQIHADLMDIETGDGANAARGWLGRSPNLEGVTFHQSTNCPTSDLICGDFSKYLMGLRTGALVESSTEAGDSFQNHQVWVKIVTRFDFATLDDSAFYRLADITT